jgi:hypothetical protein
MWADQAFLAFAGHWKDNARPFKELIAIYIGRLLGGIVCWGRNATRTLLMWMHSSHNGEGHVDVELTFVHSVTVGRRVSEEEEVVAGVMRAPSRSDEDFLERGCAVDADRVIEQVLVGTPNSGIRGIFASLHRDVGQVEGTLLLRVDR